MISNLLTVGKLHKQVMYVDGQEQTKFPQESHPVAKILLTQMQVEGIWVKDGCNASPIPFHIFLCHQETMLQFLLNLQSLVQMSLLHLMFWLQVMNFRNFIYIYSIYKYQRNFPQESHPIAIILYNIIYIGYELNVQGSKMDGMYHPFYSISTHIFKSRPCT